MQTLMQAHTSPYDPAGANGALLLPPFATVTVHKCFVLKPSKVPVMPYYHPHPPFPASLLADRLTCGL